MKSRTWHCAELRQETVDAWRAAQRLQVVGGDSHGGGGGDGLSGDVSSYPTSFTPPQTIASKHILPHGQYIVNLAHPDPVKRERAYAYFLDDLKRTCRACVP